VELAGKEELNEADVRHATGLVREILPHVSDCEGLSIMAETLPARQLQEILDRRDACNRDGLDLLQWATRLRKRPVLSAAAAGAR